ncbi:MAG: hypothetical protein R3B95_12190 [Nitrospirales bacterium]|nr:hypothetical protein [Nitrospirales bacterium]
MWEIFEFTLDQTGVVVSQFGLCDTMCDLIFDFLGATIVAGFGALSLRKRAEQGHEY